MRAALMSALAALLSVAHAEQLAPLTPRDALETARFVEGQGRQRIFLSPSGRRFAVMLVRGDAERNLVEMELRLGERSSLKAAQPRLVARLHTAGLGSSIAGTGDSAWLTVRGNNPPVWVNDRRIALLWEGDNGARQVFTIDVDTGQVAQLTHHPTDVIRFGISTKGAVLFDAKVDADKARSMRLYESGFAVTSPDAMSLLTGTIDGSGYLERISRFERFLLKADDGEERKFPAPTGSAKLAVPLLSAIVSPTREVAVLDDVPGVIPADWRRYSEESLQYRLGNEYGNVRQLFTVDMESGQVRPLWNAPLDTHTVETPLVAWSPSGDSLLVGPTFLPLSATTSSTGSVSLSEVNVRTGEFAVVSRSDRLREARWCSSNTIVAQSIAGETYRYRKAGGEWHPAPTRGESGCSTLDDRGTVRVEIRESMNDAPSLYAIDRTGREKALLDPNPGLKSNYKLGHVEQIEWSGARGEKWAGRLYRPVESPPRRRSYPLVIQTHGVPALHEFSLFGLGESLGPSWSTYLAQSLASVGIAVLQIDGPSAWSAPVANQLERMKELSSAYEVAARHLAAAGVADLSRIGLMGYSRTGWHVEYALTHSEFPYAAALVVDNIDGGYLQAALAGWEGGLAEGLNGAPPFGDGLREWLKNSPAFNAERMRTPLQIQVTDSIGGQQAPVITGWEMFSRLRHLGKPAELYVIPRVERGSHTLQNPVQVLASQERAFDWWRFWLQDAEDPGASKGAQYAAWRMLRGMQDGAEGLTSSSKNASAAEDAVTTEKPLP